MIVEAESVGQATGYVRGGYVDKPTPGCMIRFFGCMMLAVVPGALLGVRWARGGRACFSASPPRRASTCS